MLDNFIYENHLGQRFSGLENGVYLNIGELRDYTWTHETINNRISRFYRKTTNRKIPLYVVGETYAKAAEAMNHLLDITEADIAANIPGSLFVGDYYTRGFVTTSKKTKYLDNRHLCKLDLTLTSDDPSWYKNTTHSFYTDATTPKNKKSGNIVILNGAPNAPLRGLTVYGKTTQNGTPTPDAPIPLNSVGADGNVRVSAKAGLPEGGDEHITIINQPRNMTTPANTNAVFHVDAMGNGLTYQWEYWNTVSWNNSASTGNDTDTVTFTAKNYHDGYKYRCMITDASGNTLYTDAATLTIGEPTSTENPVTVQTATIATPNGLHGVPVTSGGNYTDKNGQQWIADTVEYDAQAGTAHLVQRVGSVTYDGSSDENWVLDTSGQYALLKIKNNKKSNLAKGLCTHYSGGYLGITRPDTGFSANNSSYMLFRPTDYETITLDEWRARLAESPVTVLYALAEPEIMPITGGELSALRTLKILNPDTTIINDANAYMDVVYSTVANSSGSSIGGMDYSFDHPYEYTVKMNGRSVVCDSFSDSAFRLLIYGECVNPTVNIGGHAYTVNGSVGNGETLMIDSVAKTITLTTAYGNTVNYFDKRSRDSYIFEPISSGENSVTWSGDFGFELTIIEKRSEPKWT